MSSNVRTDCFFNLTIDQRIDLFKRRQGLRIDNVFRTFFGWMVLPLALLGILLVSLFIIATYRAIKVRAVSRKCYILLLNRAVGDLVSCIVALIVCGYVLLWHEINRDMVILMESFFIGSFWSAMVSYVALSVLKLFAVWKPFQYRKWFTMKRCINLIIFRCVGLLINQDQCFFQRNYAEMMRILAIVRATLLLRILVDPILSFATDVQIRRFFFTLIGVKQQLAYGASRVYQKSSDGGSSGEISGIDRSRSQTVTTVNSNLPSTIKF
ncbi:hypothetical protein GCK32_015100 [Trichostrongylus colubriformis]|uniref:Uncharacterized protein n=1 Tax=Trichostrongylus colubriformis TaxID=6319 RepID=A0AAN8F5G2_TRICO